MGQETNILFDLIGIWAAENELYSKQGSVKSVNESERTCVVTPSDGGPDVLDVRLETDYTEGSSTDSKGFFIVPEVSSLVIITFMSKEESFISAWTQIDKIVSKQTEWIFNDGSNDGLAKIIELTSKLNDIENKVNSLITFINTHLHTTVAPGSPTTPPVPSFTGGSLTLTSKSDIENENVKH